MILILEGPDGAGKSTAANLMQTTHRIIHHGPPKPGEDLFKTYLYALLKADPNTVFDRLFHGEQVYGPIFRGVSQLTHGQVAYLELVAAQRGAVVAWCRAQPSTLRLRGDPIYTRVAPDMLLAGYAAIKRRSRLMSLTYDSSVSAPEELWRQATIMGGLDAGGQQAGVGHPSGRVALVGERLSPLLARPLRGSKRWTMEPYSLYRPFADARSRDWLMDALYLVRDYSPYQLYLTNAIKDAYQPGRSRLALRTELVAFDRVVAMGDAAAAELILVGRPADATVPHPQAHMRFSHRSGIQGYAKLLEVAVNG